jgi:hypothetical protein
VTDDVKFPPAQAVGERDAVARDLRDRKMARDILRMAVASDIDEGIGETIAVKRVEERCEYAVVLEPPVNDENFRRPLPDGPVPDHPSSLAPLF